MEPSFGSRAIYFVLFCLQFMYFAAEFLYIYFMLFLDDAACGTRETGEQSGVHKYSQS